MASKEPTVPLLNGTSQRCDEWLRITVSNTSAAGAGAGAGAAGAGAGAEKTNDDMRGTRRPRGSDLRPNYFICVRIESEVGRRKIAKLQHHVCEEAKESSGGSVTQLNEVRQTM